MSEDLSTIKTVIKDSTESAGVLSKKKLSISNFINNLNLIIDIVLEDLFKIALNSASKGEINNLNNEILNLFEELEAYVENKNLFDVSKIQSKTFGALDIK